MSEEAKKKSRRPRGAAALWIAVALLGLVYLGVWSAGKGTAKLPQSPIQVSQAPIALPSDATAALTDAAKQDAAVRSPGSQVEVATVGPKYFTTGSELKPSTPGIGTLGAIITLETLSNGKTTGQLTYYAIPPNQVQFVSQKTK